MPETRGTFSVSDEHHHGVDYERTDVGSRPLVWFSVGMVLFMLANLGVLTVLYNWLWDRNEPKLHRSETESVLVPSPGPDPPIALQELRQYEERLLNEGPRRQYGDGETVRIPIEQAIDLVLEQGLPTEGIPAGVGSRQEASQQATEQRQQRGEVRETGREPAPARGPEPGLQQDGSSTPADSSPADAGERGPESTTQDRPEAAVPGAPPRGEEINPQARQTQPEGL